MVYSSIVYKTVLVYNMKYSQCHMTFKLAIYHIPFGLMIVPSQHMESRSSEAIAPSKMPDGWECLSSTENIILLLVSATNNLDTTHPQQSVKSLSEHSQVEPEWKIAKWLWYVRELEISLEGVIVTGKYLKLHQNITTIHYFDQYFPWQIIIGFLSILIWSLYLLFYIPFLF